MASGKDWVEDVTAQVAAMPDAPRMTHEQATADRLDRLFVRMDTWEARSQRTERLAVATARTVRYLELSNTPEDDLFAMFDALAAFDAPAAADSRQARIDAALAAMPPAVTRERFDEAVRKIPQNERADNWVNAVQLRRALFGESGE